MKRWLFVAAAMLLATGALVPAAQAQVSGPFYSYYYPPYYTPYYTAYAPPLYYDYYSPYAVPAPPAAYAPGTMPYSTVPKLLGGPTVP